MDKGHRWLLMVWTSVFLLSLPTFAKAEQGHYYAILFGYEGVGNRPTDSHTFAVFIDGDAVARGQRFGFPAISWLPATGVVRPVRREPGRNFSLEETLQIAKANRYEVRAYGPYEITPDLYRRAMVRIAQLNSGRVWYRMLGVVFPGTVNCIHAVADIVGDIHTGTERGFDATQEVVNHFGPQILRRAEEVRDWVALDPIVNF